MEYDNAAFEIEDADRDVIRVRRAASIQSEVIIEVTETVNMTTSFASVMLNKDEALALAHALLGAVK